MDPVSALIVNKALDGLSARAMSTAHNIANAGAPNFRMIRVAFEDALQSASRSGASAIRSVQPRVEQAELRPGEEVRLDLELATATEISLRYAALVNLLNRQMQITRSAIRGGQ